MKEEKHFTELTKEEQQAQIEYELRETAHYLGGWDELIKRVKELQERDQVAASERYYSKY